MAIIIDASGATLARKITVPSGGSSATTLENYVTVEEDPSDISTATRHPVDSGAIMSDHIILQPPELRMRIGWSNADQQANGDAAYVRNLYAKILQVKNNRQLCQVYTGKRYYTNMWPLEIRGPKTDARTEWSTIYDIHWIQLLLVDLSSPTQSSAANSASTNPNPAAQADPPLTQPARSNGTVQPQPQTGTTPTPTFTSPNNSAILELPPVITNSNGGGASLGAAA